MLILRREQWESLRAAQRKRFIDKMCLHLRRHFGEELASMEEAALRTHVSEAIDKAADYELTTEQDCCRYLNLAATYGWGFDKEPDNAWMKNYLTDPEVSNPSQRLSLLIDECLHRMAVEENNRALEEEFGLT